MGMSENGPSGTNPVVTEAWMHEHDADIRKLAMHAAENFCHIPRYFVNQNAEEYLNDMRLKVWEHFDPERGALSTFIYNTGPRHMARLYKRHMTLTGKGAELLWNDSNVDEDGQYIDIPNPSERFDAPTEYEEAESRLDNAWLHNLIETMTPMQAAVCRAMLTLGPLDREIARDLGVSRQRVQTVRKAVGRIIANHVGSKPSQSFMSSNRDRAAERRAKREEVAV
jgi:RNA polymerase sigma factor (sigma-70 family)